MLTRNEPSPPVTIHYPGYRACTVCDFQFYPTDDETVCGLCLTAQAMTGQAVKVRKRVAKVGSVQACGYCGNEYQQKTAIQKFCSTKCRQDDEYQRRVRSKVQTVACEICGTTFDTSNSRKRLCSEACRHERRLKYMADWHERKRTEAEQHLAGWMQAASERKRKEMVA